MTIEDDGPKTNENIIIEELKILRHKIFHAKDLIIQHGGHDGEHHKEWCLDQVFRILTGDKYKEITDEIKNAGYDWKEGIAP